MSDGASSKDKKRSKSPPPGFQKVRGEYWEACKKPLNRKPVNNHTGVYAFHADDCMCGMAGWPCFRQGHIWSCCGSTEKYSKCAGQTTKGKGWCSNLMFIFISNLLLIILLWITGLLIKYNHWPYDWIMTLILLDLHKDLFLLSH